MYSLQSMYFFDSNKKSSRVDKEKNKVHKNNMSHKDSKILTNEKQFPKAIIQQGFSYGLLTDLPITFVVCNISMSSFQLKRGILPP